MKAYVVRWYVDRYHGGTDSDIYGVFLSREGAVSAIEGLAVPCYREVTGGIWKLRSSKAVETGVATLKTKDGKVWEIYGPDGRLVDGNGADEPEFRISEHEVGEITYAVPSRVRHA